MMASRPDGYKDFVPVLQLHRSFRAEEILQAIQEIGPDHVSAEQIRKRLSPVENTSGTVVIPDELKAFRLSKQSLSRYDSLAKGVVH